MMPRWDEVWTWADQSGDVDRILDGLRERFEVLHVGPGPSNIQPSTCVVLRSDQEDMPEHNPQVLVLEFDTTGDFVSDIPVSDIPGLEPTLSGLKPIERTSGIRCLLVRGVPSGWPD